MNYFFQRPEEQETASLLFHRLQQVFANADSVPPEVTQARFEWVIAGNEPLVGVVGFGDDTWDDFDPLASTVKAFEGDAGRVEALRQWKEGNPNYQPKWTRERPSYAPRDWSKLSRR